MTKPPRDIATSVKAKLLLRAKERGEDFNLVLIRYLQERLLYRLSRSSHADAFVLKGATLFTLWGGAPHRPTKDLDLLAYGDPDLERLRQVFIDICRTVVTDDGVAFDAEATTVEPIREDALYDGARVVLVARVGKTTLKLQVDCGFGDATVPPPQDVAFPTFLELPAPRLRAYAPETVVAEKLEAMVKLGMANSRMKDFFDLHYMRRTFSFDGERLVGAVRATFERRGTPLPRAVPLALSSEFAEDDLKRTQWTAFQKRVGEQRRPPALPLVVTDLRRFLEPVLEGCRSGSSPGSWSPGGPWSR